jgi:hypothetical protein
MTASDPTTHAAPEGFPAPPRPVEVDNSRAILIKGCALPFGVVLLILLVLHVYVGGWPFHYGAPVHGRVIDEHTGQPMAGAVIVGEWYTSGFLGAYYRAYASEAISDVDGKFVLPGMPLRLRVPFHRYEIADPKLSLYKPGYAVTTADNRLAVRSYRYSRAMKRVSFGDGRDLPLIPLADVAGEAKALQRMEDIAMRSNILHPRRYPRLWSVILQGARRIPPGGFAYGSGNPHSTYVYLMRHRQQ